MPEPDTHSEIATSAASRPFPWYCPNCRRKEVRRVTIRYRCQMEHNGQPVTIVVSELAVRQLRRTGVRLRGRQPNQSRVRATDSCAWQRRRAASRAPWGRRGEILISYLKTQDVLAPGKARERRMTPSETFRSNPAGNEIPSGSAWPAAGSEFCVLRGNAPDEA